MPILITLALLGGSVALGASIGYEILVPAIMVIATTIWVHSDSDEIDYPDSAIEAKVLLLWIVFFPYYLYRRREVKIAKAVSERLSETRVTDMRMTNSDSPSTRSATAGPSERACPECGETVLAVARKCKHCGSAIEPIADAPTVAEPPHAASAPAASLGAALGRPAGGDTTEGEDSGAKKIIIGIMVAAVTLGALLWFAANYEGDASTSAGGADGESRGADRTPTYAVGQPVSTSKLGITVTSVETPGRVGIEFMYESPADGGKYVAVQWEYQNNSSKPIGTFSQPRLYLADPSGTRYEPDLGASSSYAMQLDLTEKVFSDLNPGIKVRAASVFEVAETLLNQPGWTIEIVADRTIRIPLGFGKPEPVAAVESEEPTEEEAVFEEDAAAAAEFVSETQEPASTPEQIDQNRAIREAVLNGAGPPGEYPRFSDYPVAEIYQGPPAALDMTSELARTFETRLGEGLAADISTAGEYVFVTFGCGTSCVVGAFVNKRTGVVVDELLGGETGPRVVGRDVHSSLVIAEGPDENELGNFAFFYELKDSKLHLVKKVPIPPSLEEE